ncbi:hypothetical protein ACIA8O_40000 [Kitasatospora sp. NPDC051853]|uniref:hypothetical protein n=1 Tax=Kitasatospora sp. NPDC051853 TaxID=3364058 RepID=UPI0037963556
MSYQNVDPVLGVFANTIEELDYGIGVTLTTTGGVVTGQLVSGRAWAKAYTERIGLEPESPATEVLGHVFKGLQETLSPATNADTDAEEEQENSNYPSFIHLTEARYLSAGNLVPQGNDTVPWRGRLDQVVAWSVGRMGNS